MFSLNKNPTLIKKLKFTFEYFFLFFLRQPCVYKECERVKNVFYLITRNEKFPLIIFSKSQQHFFSEIYD